MGPLMPRVKTRTYIAHSRQIQPTQRRVHSYREWKTEHIMHAQGRYNPLTNGSTHVVSMHKMIMSTQWYILEADTAHSQMGPLMPRVKTTTYIAHSRQIQPTQRRVHSCREWKLEHILHTRGRYSPLIDGPTHVESMTTGTNSKEILECMV